MGVTDQNENALEGGLDGREARALRGLVRNGPRTCTRSTPTRSLEGHRISMTSSLASPSPTRSTLGLQWSANLDLGGDGKSGYVVGKMSRRSSATRTPIDHRVWHPDPAGRHRLRYWNGERWTRFVLDTNDASPRWDEALDWGNRFRLPKWWKPLVAQPARQIGRAGCAARALCVRGSLGAGN